MDCTTIERPAGSAAGAREGRIWTVGRISLVILLFVAFIAKVVNKQMNRIDSRGYYAYDALSSAVIRPAFLYKTRADKPSIGLGRAAISSITIALSPIIPFTSGVDLRRTEHYNLENLFGNLAALAKQTFDTFSNPKYIDNADDNAVVRNSTKTSKGKPFSSVPTVSKKVKRNRHSPLSSSHPIVAHDHIAQLTLEDFAAVLEYAMKITQDNFNGRKYISSALPRVKTVLQGMNAAVMKSSGNDVQVAKVGSDDIATGNMDAFYFCAAARIFADWRILRQVPDGYKGYAFGMNLGHKDVVQNVAKIERAAHNWIDYQLESGNFSSKIKSPTLREMLQFEIASGEQPTLPRLKETTGAMGLLWVRRQLHYQTVIFENILQVPLNYQTSKDAVSAAYSEVYNNYHGWAIQKVFSYSFAASPPVEEVYKFMNPHKLEEAKARLARTKTLAPTNETDRDHDKEDRHPDNFFHQVGWKIEKLVNGIGQLFGKPSRDNSVEVRGGHSSNRESGLTGDEIEEIICSEMSKNVHEHIIRYLEVAQPLLYDLAGLFVELDMDDPSKV